MWKDEIKKERTRPKPSPLPDWFLDDDDDVEITTSNALSATRLVEFDIARKMLNLHKDLQSVGTNLLESAVKLHNENIGPNSEKIDVSPIELIKLLHRYQLAMKGYVRRSDDY